MAPARLGRPLGRPGWPLDVSRGPSGRAKEVFGHHFGTPWDASGALGGDKVYARACGQRFGFHSGAFLFVTVHASWTGRGLRAHQTLT